jgi:hypothetical protein
VVVSRKVSQTIDYRCDNEKKKKVGENRGDIGTIRHVLTPFFSKPGSSPLDKRTVQPKDAFEDTTFKPRFDIAKF